MTRVYLATACCLALALGQGVVRLDAQPADPISGRWGQDGTTLLDLQFDGKSGISGTIFVVGGGSTASAPIRVGTFDPATGSLRLEGDIKGPETSRSAAFLIEGKLQSGTLSVAYTFAENNKGTATLTRLGERSSAKPSARTTAAPASEPDVSTVLRKHFQEVSGLVLEAANQVPADKYGYRPTTSVRTFAQLVGHLADSYQYYCVAPDVRKPTPPNAAPAKADLVAKLKEVTDVCLAATGLAPEALIGNIAHANLHYGNMITYLRMLGLVPPSS